jgi:hypothetical protein
VLFVASAVVVSIALWYSGGSVLVPRWRASAGLLAYGLYAARNAKPQPWALKVDAQQVLLLLVPFGIGLVSFLGAIAG